MLVSCSGKEPKSAVEEFMNARKEGSTKAAYGMLDEKSRSVFSEKEFEEYCFIYRISEFEIAPAENGYIGISYKFFDKKFKKGSDELYTYYITDNIERIKVVKGKIIFPHVAFVAMRKAIEDKDIEKAKHFSDVMLDIDPENPDVLETAVKMGFIPAEK